MPGLSAAGRDPSAAPRDGAHATEAAGAPAGEAPRARTERPAAPSSRAVAWCGAILVVVSSIGLLALLNYNFDAEIAAENERIELLATVLEDHATRTVDATANTLAALADQMASPTNQQSPELITPYLVQSMVSLPALRGIALVDLKGTVLGSTMPAEVGLQIDLKRLGPLPDPGKDSLGPFIKGRGLVQLSRDVVTMQGGPGVAFIPLIRHVPVPGAQGLLLVGLLNPDRFASYQQLTVKDEHTAALLTNYTGTVLATLPWVPIEAGTRLLEHPLFSDFTLQQREYGRYQGAGARPGDQLVAFRVSRTRPLTVLVEQPREEVVKRWWVQSQPFVLVRLLVIAMVLVVTFYLWRTLRAVEASAADREHLRSTVARRERDLAELFKLVPELIFRCDRHGVIDFVNARYADLTGRTTDQAIGSALTELVAPASRELVLGLFDPDRGPVTRRCQATLPAAYGVERRFDISVVPLYEGDQLRGFAGSAVDLTERLMLQDKLRGQVEHTARLLELCPVPVSITDVDNRYISVNRAWEEFNMRNRTEVLGRPVGEQMAQGERTAYFTWDQRMLSGGGSETRETYYTRVDQSRRLVRFSKVAIPGEDGKPVAILNAFIDLTDYRNAQRAMEQARQAAEEVSRLKSELIAGVSHELRTPLQSVLGFSEIALTRDLPVERQRALFTEIHASGKGMLSMVNDLLDLAKIESGPVAVDHPAIDIREPIAAVCRELGPLFEGKRLALALNLGDKPLMARIDPLRCQQLVRNVLANAIKVSPLDGRIEVDAVVAGGKVQVRLRDEGPGIPDGELERIFEPFIQSSLTQGKPGAGTGLGLAICRKIVQGCNGSLTARNLPAGGASFELDLPDASLAAERSHPLAALAA